MYYRMYCPSNSYWNFQLQLCMFKCTKMHQPQHEASIQADQCMTKSIEFKMNEIDKIALFNAVHAATQRCFLLPFNPDILAITWYMQHSCDWKDKSRKINLVVNYNVCSSGCFLVLLYASHGQTEINCKIDLIWLYWWQLATRKYFFVGLLQNNYLFHWIERQKLMDDKIWMNLTM